MDVNLGIMIAAMMISGIEFRSKNICPLAVDQVHNLQMLCYVVFYEKWSSFAMPWSYLRNFMTSKPIFWEENFRREGCYHNAEDLPLHHNEMQT